MKTFVTLLKLAMLITTLSFVMSCDKANKKTNNTAVNTGVYTYGANGTCNGNSSLYVFLRGQQYACQTDQRSYSDFTQYGGCWVSCAQTNCSGQIAYPAGSTAQNQGYQCL